MERSEIIQSPAGHGQVKYAPSVPLPLKIFAWLFILAPFGNLYLSFRSMKIPDGFIWGHWGMLLKLVSPSDGLRMLLTFMGGLVLFRARKSSWALALVAVGGALAVSLRDLFLQNSVQHIPGTYLFLFLASSIFAALVLYFFRFPYLDRRDTWWGISVRHEVDRPIEYRVGLGEWLPGRLLNVSNSGALIHVAGHVDAQKVEIRFSSEVILSGIVHRVEEEQMGVEFSFDSLKHRWVFSRKLPELCDFNDVSKKEQKYA